MKGTNLKGEREADKESKRAKETLVVEMDRSDLNK